MEQKSIVDLLFFVPELQKTFFALYVKMDFAVVQRRERPGCSIHIIVSNVDGLQMLFLRNRFVMIFATAMENLKKCEKRNHGNTV